VVERRHENLDAFVLHDRDAAEDVLLGWKRLHARDGPAARRRAREPVDELVHARGAESPGGRARERLSPSQSHGYGRTRTRLRSIRSRLRTTFA